MILGEYRGDCEGELDPSTVIYSSVSNMSDVVEQFFALLRPSLSGACVGLASWTSIGRTSDSDTFHRALVEIDVSDLSSCHMSYMMPLPRSVDVVTGTC